VTLTGKIVLTGPVVCEKVERHTGDQLRTRAADSDFDKGETRLKIKQS